MLKTVPLVFVLLCLNRLSKLYDFTDAIKALMHVVHLVLVGTLVQLLIVPHQAYGTSGDDAVRQRSSIPTIASDLFGLVIGVGLMSQRSGHLEPELGSNDLNNGED